MIDPVIIQRIGTFLHFLCLFILNVSYLIAAHIDFNHLYAFKCVLTTAAASIMEKCR